jgi:MFS family permease
MAVIPPYATIGVAAPILAIVARMTQGFSLGGEVGPTTAFLLEAAPPGRRGLAVSWQAASQNIAVALGGFVGVGLSSVMAPAALDSYGWRIAFLLGAATLPFGLWIRRGLPETLHLPDPVGDTSGHGAGDRGVWSLVREHRRIIVLTFTVMAAATSGTYVFNYMVTFAQTALHMTPRVSFLASALGNAVGVGSVLYGGWLCDRIGRRPLLIFPNLAYLIVVLPLYFWIIASRSALALVVSMMIIGFFNSLNAGALYSTATEALPRRIRGRVFALVYASAIALFGGGAQLVVTWLIKVTGSPMSPAWYLFAATLIGQIALTQMIPRARPKLALAPVAAR